MKLSGINLAMLVVAVGESMAAAQQKELKEPDFMRCNPVAFKDHKQDWQSQGKRRKPRLK